jgi:hypothetical protein
MFSFNIAEFKSNISNGGVLQNNKFVVFIPIPPFIFSNFFSDVGNALFNVTSSYNFLYRAEQASIPGISIQTQDVRRMGMGVAEKMPYNVAFQDTSISFLADAKGDVHRFFYSWLSNVTDFKQTALGAIASAFGFGSSSSSYEINYKSNYATDIYIFVFDNVGNMVKTITLYDAYPVSLNEIPLDWASPNSLMKVNVGITFKHWSLLGVNDIGSDIVNLAAGALGL